MKTARQHTRDRHEDRGERQEKLGQASDTMPHKTLRDRTPAARRDIPRSQAARVAFEPKPNYPARANAAEVPDVPAAHFSLFAPGAQIVQLAGTFNDWNPSTTSKDSDGCWRLQINLEPGAYEYRFIVDGEWQEDPMARDSVPNPFGSRNSLKHVV